MCVYTLLAVRRLSANKAFFEQSMALDNVGTNLARRHPPNTAVSLKKGELNTPYDMLFFKKENGGLDFYSKTAVWH